MLHRIACNESRHAVARLVLLVLASAAGCEKLPNTMEVPADTRAADIVRDAIDTALTDLLSDDGKLDGDADADAPSADVVTIETSCMGTLIQGRAPGEPVAVDLCPYLGDPAASGAALRKIADPAELIAGPAALGRVGDFIMETGTARFVVQGVERHATPCPYGGSVIDATYLGPNGDQPPTPDHAGEVCLFVQLGRTLRPMQDDAFVVLRDGSDGGAAVLAVTSVDALDDWVSLANAAREYVGNLVNTPFDPEVELGLTITTYYIARPGENRVIYLTAVRNDAGARRFVVGGDLIDSGGVVEFFNPLSSLKGFGYRSIEPEKLHTLIFAADDASFAYVPTHRGFDADGQVIPDASYGAVSGAAATFLGTDDPMPLLIGGDAARSKPGSVDLQPGDVHLWERSLYVGSGDLATITDAVAAHREQPTGHVEGKVVDEAGAGVPGVRVAAVYADDQTTKTRFLTDNDGVFAGNLAPGTYTLQPDPVDRAVLSMPTVDVVVDATLAPEATVSAPGVLRVSVRNGLDQAAIPAKVTVTCDSDCPRAYGPHLRDTGREGLGARTADVFFVGAEGTADRGLPPGTYRVVVSRGPVWTVHPMGAAGVGPAATSEPVIVPAGGIGQVDATLWPAVDTSGFLSADFHVHAVGSPDAPVANSDRVLSFMAAGVDVLISTDHDHITAFAPVIALLGAQGSIASVPGEELTTFDYGHFNAFPLTPDPDDIKGGAVDWAVDEAPPLHPAAIAAALNAFDGEQVVQINHPEGGYFGAIRVDAARGISTRDPSELRLPPVVPDPTTGDTGLFAPDFTAIEVLNGYNRERFWRVMNWWFALVANGYAPTATAVSDSHRLYTDIGGEPRTWVEVGAGTDTVATFDPAQFAAQSNAGRAVGSTGPFVRFWATNSAGEQAQMGDAIAGSPSSPVTLHVEVQTPLWMTVDTIALYGNITQSAPAPGEVNGTPATPLATHAVTMGAATLRPPPGRTEPLVGHTVRTTFEVSPDGDSFYLVMVEGRGAASMWPVVWSDTKPFAFTNPIYVDADGGGYDRPPGAEPAGAGGARPPSSGGARWMNQDDWQKLVEGVRGDAH